MHVLHRLPLLTIVTYLILSSLITKVFEKKQAISYSVWPASENFISVKPVSKWCFLYVWDLNESGTNLHNELTVIDKDNAVENVDTYSFIDYEEQRKRYIVIYKILNSKAMIISDKSNKFWFYVLNIKICADFHEDILFINNNAIS